MGAELMVLASVLHVGLSEAFCPNSSTFHTNVVSSSNFSFSTPHGIFECAAMCLGHRWCQSFTFWERVQGCALNSDLMTSNSANLDLSGSRVLSSDITSWPKSLAGICSNFPCPLHQMCTVSRANTPICSQPPLGTVCSVQRDCEHYGRARCASNNCVCDPGFYLTRGEKKCMPVVGKMCASNDDCIPPTTCNHYQNTCTCAVGYSLDAEQMSCRSTAECEHFSDEYTSYANISVCDQDVKILVLITMSRCMDWCLTITSFVCSAVEFSKTDGKCYLNKVTWNSVRLDEHCTDKKIVYSTRNCDWSSQTLPTSSLKQTSNQSG